MAEKHIVSPLPGTFFRRPGPDKPPYKSEGDTVTAGDPVGLIEVMKTFYEVKAEFGGRIVKFLVEDNAEVQAGQPIVTVSV